MMKTRYQLGRKISNSKFLVACRQGEVSRGASPFCVIGDVAMKTDSMEKMEITTDVLEILINKDFREAYEKAVDTIVERIDVPESYEERRELAVLIARKAIRETVNKVLGKGDLSNLSHNNKKALKSQVFD